MDDTTWTPRQRTRLCVGSVDWSSPSGDDPSGRRTVAGLVTQWDPGRVEARFTSLKFAAPRIDREIDIDAILARLPPRIATKGLTVKAALDRLQARPDLAEWTDERVLAGAGVPTQRPGLLQDIPWGDYLRLTVFVARLLRGPDRVPEGLREIGRGMYGVFGETLIGRMLFGTLGRNFGRVLLMGPNGWRICDNFGEVRAEQWPGQHVQYHFFEYPLEIVETTFLGTIEGACDWHDVDCELLVASPEERHTIVDIVWKRRGAG
jgi:uncharacterized protein (TIGR02265 family)